MDKPVKKDRLWSRFVSPELRGSKRKANPKPPKVQQHFIQPYIVVPQENNIETLYANWQAMKPKLIWR